MSNLLEGARKHAREIVAWLEREFREHGISQRKRLLACSVATQ